MALWHADIMTVPTTGASAITAGYDNLPFIGVKASHHMADDDLQNMNLYESKIKNVARRNKVDPALLAGIISRQSCAGSILINGWGDNENCFGLMQVNKTYYKPCGSWNSEEHLNQATEILIKMMDSINNKFPGWNAKERLKGAVAAYMCGANCVLDENVDKYTAGKDFANDVIARAQRFKQHGF
ncbi:lysozyme g-like [Bombina bombina]|uniref:lysozyme g-like n=1 Tax=Bombina bombina TaxID=8345 RepID=UPI00235AF218|nr:lysozyme g-like [Bombina bombina]